ncbi:MAG: ATP-binding protein, partial [Thermomicrobiales bacterium]
AEIEHHFERFYRGASGVASAHHGAGLGLSLVQQIAEAHGGRVGIASFVAVGTTVTVLLPRSAHRFISRLPILSDSADHSPIRAE